MKTYLLFILLALTSMLSAQKKDTTEHLTKLSIFVLKYDESLTQLHWLDSTGKLDKGTPINTSTSSIMAPIKYKGPKKMTLCSLKKNATPEGVQFTPVAKVTLPESKNTILILIPSSPKKKSEKGWLPYRAVAIDDNDKKFIAGSRFVFNLTNSPVRGITGEVPFQPSRKDNNRFVLEAGKSTIVKSLSGKTFNQIYLEQRAPASKEWKRFKSSRWFHMPNRRKFVFIYQQGNTPPRLKIVSQNMTTPKPVESSDNSLPNERM